MQENPKNYKKAFKCFKKAKKTNYTNAYVNIGYCYQNGIYKDANPKLAKQYYKQASELGDLVGKQRYSELVIQKHFLILDQISKERAIEDIKLIIESNDFSAYSTIQYKQQAKVAQEKLSKAVTNLYQVINANPTTCPSAYAYLGLLYQRGYGVTKDLHLAKHFYKLSNQYQFSDQATIFRKLAQIYSEQLNISKFAQDERILENNTSLINLQTNQASINKKAKKIEFQYQSCLQDAAKLQDKNALYELGLNEQKANRHDIAKQFFEQAAQLGSGDAYYQLGVYENETYKNTRNLQYKEMRNAYYQKANNLGCTEAAIELKQQQEKNISLYKSVYQASQIDKQYQQDIQNMQNLS